MNFEELEVNNFVLEPDRKRFHRSDSCDAYWRLGRTRDRLDCTCIWPSCGQNLSRRQRRNSQRCEAPCRTLSLSKMERFWLLAPMTRSRNTRARSTEVVDLAGRALLPGFIDGHGHCFATGIQAASANWLAPPDYKVTDIPGILAELKTFAKSDTAKKQTGTIPDPEGRRCPVERATTPESSRFRRSL